MKAIFRHKLVRPECILNLPKDSVILTAQLEQERALGALGFQSSYIIHVLSDSSKELVKRKIVILEDYMYSPYLENDLVNNANYISTININDDSQSSLHVFDLGVVE